ncbi:MAG: endolytic transglycosylase MltG [Fimbriimonadales bacterium]
MSKRSRKGFIFLGLIVTVAITCWLLFIRALAPVGGEKRTFQVMRDDTVSKVASRLETEKLIRSASAVALHYRVFKPSGMLRAGPYLVDTSQSGDEILRSLLQSEPTQRIITIRPGLWATQFAELLEKSEIGKSAEVLKEISTPKKYEEALGFAVHANRLDGYLLPDSYDFAPGTEVSSAIGRICENFKRKALPLFGGMKPADIHRTIILASLVEKEAELDSERSRIAGVISNRIQKGMRLEIDATVTYALGEERRIYFKEYATQSPYNTYLHKGLPPGPICSPGLRAIEAALKPERHDLLFYVAKGDGGHLFAKGYEEHRKNIAKVRAKH